MKKLISVLLCLLLCCAPASFAEAVPTPAPASGYTVDVLSSVFGLLEDKTADIFFIDNVSALSALIGQDARPLASEPHWTAVTGGLCYLFQNTDSAGIILNCEDGLITSVELRRAFPSAADAASAAALFFTTLETTPDLPVDPAYAISPSADEFCDFAEVFLALYATPPTFAAAFLPEDGCYLLAIYSPDSPQLFSAMIFPSHS